ncbi:hypothetical protein HYH02_012090 [Chlamydomonas schloesseri]|uniref:Uncharacterized protein n=1 Tax=Chlamydomonas schloesseri TaxID=2026947 RepID=A0A835W0M7_9CHLO|nr:hypothetical protein HYH02_012090 [Chlamydomonas schloesseri]|eukprot:KAG2434890.1 hypothetical protein HYH02_012090 [Chlamydomonas schloesseri]
MRDGAMQWMCGNNKRARMQVAAGGGRVAGGAAASDSCFSIHPSCAAWTARPRKWVRTMMPGGVYPTRVPAAGLSSLRGDAASNASPAQHGRSGCVS